jgi:hypothetical protein
MGLWISGPQMTSSDTSHRAVCKWVGDGEWAVSWLEHGPALSRNQAITAMTLAEIITGAVRPVEPWTWALIEDLAGELGCTGNEAEALISGEPAQRPATNARPDQYQAKGRRK